MAASGLTLHDPTIPRYRGVGERRATGRPIAEEMAPIWRPPARFSNPLRITAENRVPRKLVFVAESNVIDCRSAKELVEELGYEAIAVADVENAIAIFPHTRADLVLTAFPLPLPEDPAREFASYVRREAPRVIMLALVTQASDARKAMLAGCDGFFAKPLDAALLKVQLLQMIGPPREWPTLEP